jgi:photosystem II stability/assembly factor-like uncharacterized protein
MSRVRVLVGTQKGAFVLSADGKRDRWDVGGPHFPGCEISHVSGSPVQPSRLYASQIRGAPGPQIQRSESGGLSWQSLGAMPARMWQLRASLADADTVYAASEDAALLRSTDGGASWDELPGLREHSAGVSARPALLLDPSNPERIYAALPAGAFRSDDGGTTWRPISEPGTAVHGLTLHPEYPDRLYMQKRGGVMRTFDAGGKWEDVTGNLPAAFGFTVAVHAHEPETIYVVPMKSDLEDFPLDGKLRVYRSRSGGVKWEPLTTGLPQRDCYVSVPRNALCVDNIAPCGAYFGTTGGAVYGSNDGGDSWTPIVRDLPPVYSVEVQTLA